MCPLAGGRYRDNWDLSSARSLESRIICCNRGSDGWQRWPEGYADTKPVASNTL